MTRSLTRDDLRAIGDLQAKISKFFYDNDGGARFDRDDFYLEVTIKLCDALDGGQEVGRFVEEDGGWIGFQAAARPVAAPGTAVTPPGSTWTYCDTFAAQTGAQG